jgi:hypothetical protein
MALSFPSSPVSGQQSTQNGIPYRWDGYVWSRMTTISGHASTHTSNGSDPVTIISSQMSDFNTSVSGLIPTVANNIYLWSNFR